MDLTNAHCGIFEVWGPISQGGMSRVWLARHKELSIFTSTDVRLQASYDIIKGGWKFLDKGTLNIVYDHMLFDYQNFRDLRVTGMTPGTEPLYNFDADVLQVFVSFWF